MKYRYLLEEKANKFLSYEDIRNTNSQTILYILCYHIEDSCKYPFLQFMLMKIPYCNNIVKEQLTLPYVICNEINNINIQQTVLTIVKHNLQLLDCDINKIDDEMYKGIIFGEDTTTPYAMVNITGIDIGGIYLTRNTNTWFATTSELINMQKICGIPIDDELTTFFSDSPTIGLLKNKHSEKYYITPDVVYTSGKMKHVEFCSIFGNCKTKVYDSCGEYYYFYRSFDTAVTPKIETDDYGINRYALFVEDNFHFEYCEELSLTEEDIETKYPEMCIIIYINSRSLKPDMLVKNQDSFVCLSYHKLNNNSYNENESNYKII